MVMRGSGGPGLKSGGWIRKPGVVNGAGVISGELVGMLDGADRVSALHC